MRTVSLSLSRRPKFSFSLPPALSYLVAAVVVVEEVEVADEAAGEGWRWRMEGRFLAVRRVAEEGGEAPRA